MSQKSNWKHTSILIEPGIYKQLRIMAAQQDTTASELITQLIKKEVESQK